MSDVKPMPLKGDHHERWEHIARELGDYEIVDTGFAYSSHRELILVSDEHYVGEWVDAEKACKRLAALEAERKMLRDLIDDLTYPDTCHYDHHGYCQAHSLQEKPCPHERSKALEELSDE